MMTNSNEQTLSELIKEFYQRHKGEDYLDEIKIIDSWRSVVGDFIADHTLDITIRKGVVYVRVDADSLRNELIYSKTILIKNLNAIVKKNIVKEIIFK